MARSKAFDENEVLDKAVNLFWSKGYNGTSAQDLVDSLGLSRSSLYDTFSDKRTLFIKALQHYRTKMGGAALQMIKQSDNPAQTIKELFKMVINDSCNPEIPKGCFIINSMVELAPSDPEVAAIVNGNAQDMEDAFYQAVKKGQESGQFSTKSNPRAVARLLFNTLSGMRVAARSGMDKKSLDDIVKSQLTLLS
ncbi:transcriptional regulator, TetR family [Filimonas lacunae]|uniref:Transcriptional regulator, TetR family n=1 Tax=Filimonas lacunae TaxID=477680 RepID=A0A173MDS1_9BACT|nr:TetR/AcrR family transcriptional regulator [Filimonas lacunae]BAV05667.1 transcriptional regulator, TetR family [Filimonas lacunae]SIT28977.1 transcriptional regulator, TetR family [Filimonas lacunae]